MTAKPCIECAVDASIKPLLPEDVIKRMLEGADSVTVDNSASKEIKLLKTTLNDPHVKRIMDHVASGDQNKIKALEKEIEERMKSLECVAQVSPVLYEAACDNIIESVLFDKFWARKTKPDLMKELETLLGGNPHHVDKAPEVTTAPKFDTITFSRLVSKIKAESKSFFPLRNMIDFHTINNPSFKVVGTGINERDEKRFASIDTACATDDGTFVFNKHFCQGLLDFAHLKGIKANPGKFGKKYMSQGGEIPDEWEYIEFLIRHELMHYTYSDFHYRKIIKESTPTLINWVGDFRSNHRLVQQGFNQLPMGLFSSYVNFHKQGSYREMFDLVKGEFDKIKGKCKQNLEDSMQGDDHSEGGSGTDGEPGEPKDGKGEPGDHPADKMSDKDIDDWNKRVDAKAKEDANPTDEATNPDYENKPKPSNPGTARGGRHGIDYSQVSPRYKWDALLKKMVGETAYIMEPTYQKISRRGIGTMQQVITRGRGAIKPGEVKNPSKKKIKLAVIIDSSGSMSYVIHKVMANLDDLLVKRKGVTGVHDEFYLFVFSGDYDIYKCTPGAAGTAENVTDVNSEKPGPHGKLKLTDVLSAHKAGGTVFSSSLASQAQILASRGYNVLVVSDGDMLAASNLANFKELYNKHSKRVWLLLDSQQTFTSFVSAMKEISNNASHL